MQPGTFGRVLHNATPADDDSPSSSLPNLQPLRVVNLHIQAVQAPVRPPEVKVVKVKV